MSKIRATKFNNNIPNCIKTERFVKVTIFTDPTGEDSYNLDRSKL